MTDITSEPVAKKRGLKWVFIGDKGLRAGWAMLLFAFICAALVFGLNVALHFAHVHGPSEGGNVMTAQTTLMSDGALSAILLIATVVTALIQRRKLSQLGLSLRNALPRFVQGLVVGVLALSGLIGMLYLCHAIKVGPIVLHGADALRSGGMWGLAFLVVGLAEELAFRTFLQQTLARGLNFRWACLIMGALFLGAHTGNGGETVIGLSMVFVAGVVLSLSVWKTGTIWWAVGFHAAWDWAQTYLYGVADSGYPANGALMLSQPAGPAWLSGGTTGPEGSILALVAMLAVAGIIYLTLRKQDEVLDIKW